VFYCRLNAHRHRASALIGCCCVQSQGQKELSNSSKRPTVMWNGRSKNHDIDFLEVRATALAIQFNPRPWLKCQWCVSSDRYTYASAYQDFSHHASSYSHFVSFHQKTQYSVSEFSSSVRQWSGSDLDLKCQWFSPGEAPWQRKSENSIVRVTEVMIILAHTWWWERGLTGSDPSTRGRIPVVLEVLFHSRAISTREIQNEIVLGYLYYLGFYTVRSGVIHL